MVIQYGSTLTKLRKANSCTQQVLAESLFVSRSTYSAWENNNHEIPLSKLFEVAKFYSLSILDLIKMLEIENSINLTKTELPLLIGQETDSAKSIYIFVNSKRSLDTKEG